jgi:hypothetical protein
MSIVRIKFTPTIKGRDVQRVMDNPDVDDELALLGISKSKAHDLVKKIMIVTFKSADYDINKIISEVKS